MARVSKKKAGSGLVVTRAELRNVAAFLEALAAAPWATDTEVLKGLSVVDIKIVPIGDVCHLEGVPPTAQRGDTLTFASQTAWLTRVTFSDKGAAELDKKKTEPGSNGTDDVHIRLVNYHQPPTKVHLELEWSKDNGKTWITATGGGPDMGIVDPKAR